MAAALTLNLSHGGIAIRTTSPLELGAKIKVRFRMPGSKRDIDGEGRVAWSDRRVGMGIQFEKVEPANQAVIDTFVDAHFLPNPTPHPRSQPLPPPLPPCPPPSSPSPPPRTTHTHPP